MILLLAYMALCRIRTVEQLQYESPGELGKLMGLDRVSEVRCLRNKLKFPKEDWPVSEFSEVTATMPTGERVAVKLAERGSLVGTDRVWMREVRKLTSSGHQTSLISTAFGCRGLQDAVALFSRWSQENSFRYMMQHFAIDALSEYRAETAMSTLLREALRRGDDSRSLLRDLFRSDADVIPDGDGQVLRVRLHTLANPRSNRAVQHLLDHLNATESTYPGTNFRIRYSLGSPENGVTDNSG